MNWFDKMRKNLSNLIYDQNYNCEKFNEFSNAFDNINRDSLTDSEFENPMEYYKSVPVEPNCTLLKFTKDQHSKEFLEFISDCIYTFYNLKKCNTLTISENKLKNNKEDPCTASYNTEFILKEDGYKYLHIEFMSNGEIKLDFCDFNLQSNKIRIEQIIKYICDCYKN